MLLLPGHERSGKAKNRAATAETAKAMISADEEGKVVTASKATMSKY